MSNGGDGSETTLQGNGPDQEAQEQPVESVPGGPVSTSDNGSCKKEVDNIQENRNNVATDRPPSSVRTTPQALPPEHVNDSVPAQPPMPPDGIADGRRLEEVLQACCLDEPDPEADVEYSNYENELQMPEIMQLIQRDLSEPYSIYTYRYFINNWPNLCFLVSGSMLQAVMSLC